MHNNGCNYLSMLGLKLNHVSKRGHWKWLTAQPVILSLGYHAAPSPLQPCNIRTSTRDAFWYTVYWKKLRHEPVKNGVNYISYMLSRERRIAENQHSQLLFNTEDCLCTNLPVQKQSTYVTSQCQYLAFAWQHRLNCGHNAKYVKTVLDENGVRRNRWLFWWF